MAESLQDQSSIFRLNKIQSTRQLKVITNTHYIPKSFKSSIQSPISSKFKQFHENIPINRLSPNIGVTNSPYNYVNSPMHKGLLDMQIKQSPFMGMKRYEKSPDLDIQEKLMNFDQEKTGSKNMHTYNKNRKSIPFSEEFYQNLHKFLDEHNLFIVDPEIYQVSKYNALCMLHYKFLHSMQPLAEVDQNICSIDNRWLALSMITESKALKLFSENQSKNWRDCLTLDRNISGSSLFKRRLQKMMPIINEENLNKIDYYSQDIYKNDQNNIKSSLFLEKINH